ncbi:hypothetical protein MTP03_15530 [Tsukamurella sp. PLM1]|nr:hypothetical protein MTP03_15530 [Tsukamurella sp. PLM1]
MIPAVLTAATTFVAWCLLSRRMDRWGVSAPLAMVLAGGAVGFGAHGAIAEAVSTGAAQRTAEIILAVLLFVDATDVRGSLLGRHPGWWPGRCSSASRSAWPSRCSSDGSCCRTSAGRCCY